MQTTFEPISMFPLVLVRTEPPGQITAQLVGLPELRATAATREEALRQVRQLLGEWLASGRLAALEMRNENPWRTFAGWAKGDPEYSQFLDAMQRCRQDIEAEQQG